MRTLEITTAVGCPMSCSCCPQDVLLNAYGGPPMMCPNLFKSALDGTPVNVRIDFSGFCEPFANSYATDMILEAHDRGHSVAVFTTGVGLNVEQVRRMARVSFDTFELHLQDKKGISDIPQSDGLSSVIQEIKGKLGNVIAGDLSRIKRVSRAGNVPSIAAPRHAGIITCKGKAPARFVMLPDGMAVLCCMDYGLRHPCGDITVLGYEGLMATKGYGAVLDGMTEGDVLCRSCEMAVAL